MRLIICRRLRAGCRTNRWGCGVCWCDKQNFVALSKSSTNSTLRALTAFWSHLRYVSGCLHWLIAAERERERARRRTGISQTRHCHIKPTSFPGNGDESGSGVHFAVSQGATTTSSSSDDLQTANHEPPKEKKKKNVLAVPNVCLFS